MILFGVTVGVYDVGDHHERLHAVLVSVLRARASPSFCGPAGSGHPPLALFPFPLARIRQ